MTRGACLYWRQLVCIAHKSYRSTQRRFSQKLSKVSKIGVWLRSEIGFASCANHKMQQISYISRKQDLSAERLRSTGERFYVNKFLSDPGARDQSPSRSLRASVEIFFGCFCEICERCRLAVWFHSMRRIAWLRELQSINLRAFALRKNRCALPADQFRLDHQLFGGRECFCRNLELCGSVHRSSFLGLNLGNDQIKSGH